MTDSSPSSLDDPWRDLAPAPRRELADREVGGTDSGSARARMLPLETASPTVPIQSPEVVRAVPVAPEQQLRQQVTEAHLAMGSAHGDALRVLSDVASGRTTEHRVTREGEVVEVPVAAATRVSAARALLDHAATMSKPNGVTLTHGGAMSVGELIARIDPERLREAVRRLREES